MMDTPLEQMLRHDRLIVLAAIAAVTLIAWIYTIRLAGMEMPAGLNEMMAPVVSPCDVSRFSLMWAMWAAMMVGMMLPSVTPMILIYTRVARHASSEGKPFASAGWFIGGYFIAWTLFATAATMAQLALEQSAQMSPKAMTVGPAVGGVVLIVAGLYQFTPWKDVCLAQCRAPLAFIQRHGGFQREALGSVLLGTRHGLYCVGCCWTLMCLLFVVGIMNLIWIAGITVLVLLEKIVPARLQVPRIAGVALIAAGASAFF